MAKPQRAILSKAQWAEARALFDRCLALDPKAREALLHRETVGKEWLRQEVDSLLAASRTPEGFLSTPFISRLSSERTPTFRPQRVGKYLLAHPLGRGGMAEVFLAKFLGPSGFERLVAVKRMLSLYASDPEIYRRFEYEAKLCGRLTHANIVHLYDFAVHDGAYLLVMEYVNGVNLAQVIERVTAQGHKIPADLSLRIVAKAAEGLEYAYSCKDAVTGEPLGIIHRDISPKNLMISFDGTTKIVDFGIAKARDRVAFTQSGVLRGTVGYLSPEMLSGSAVDARSDLFSLTVILYELLSGGPFFNGGEMAVVLRQIGDEQYYRRRIEELSVDDNLKHILVQGLDPDPQKRYASAGGLRNDITAYLAAHYPPELPERLAAFLESHFSDEIAKSKKTIENVRRMSIPLEKDSSRIVEVERASSRLSGLRLAVLILTLTAGAFLGRQFRTPPPTELAPPRATSALPTPSPIKADAPVQPPPPPPQPQREEPRVEQRPPPPDPVVSEPNQVIATDQEVPVRAKEPPPEEPPPAETRNFEDAKVTPPTKEIVESWEAVMEPDSFRPPPGMPPDQGGSFSGRPPPPPPGRYGGPPGGPPPGGPPGGHSKGPGRR